MTYAVFLINFCRLWAVCFCIAALCTSQVVAQDRPLSQVLQDNSPWHLGAEGFKFAEAPAVDKYGRLYFSDVAGGRVCRLNDGGKAEIIVENDGNTSGLMFGPTGLLFGCLYNAKQIVAYKPDESYYVLAALPSTNDLVVSREGCIYVMGPKSHAVWLVKHGSKAKSQKMAEGFRPNGITLWQDDTTLVVPDRESPVSRTYRVETDGSLMFGDADYSPLQTASIVRRTAAE